MTIDELRREALGLDLSSRARLAHELLNSLDDLSEAEIEQLWLEESQRRLRGGRVRRRRDRERRRGPGQGARRSPMSRLRLHPVAQLELDEAAAYYDAESPGLGSAFLSD